MKRRRFVRVNHKKKIIIIFCISVFIIALSSFAYYFIFYKGIFNKNVIFKLNEPLIQELEVHTDYEELGCSVYLNDVDNTDKLKIDISKLNVNILGEYKVKYYITIKKKEYSYYRKVKVVDTTPPEMTLNGNEEVNLVVGDTYEELGGTATDNYDGDITDKIEISGEVDTSKDGEYIITYTVVDTSNNTSSVTRKVVIAKPKKVVYKNTNEDKAPSNNSFNASSYSNTITLNKFTNSGIYFEGTKKDHNDNYKILLDDKYSFDMTSNGEGKYKGSINLDSVDNGTYNVYIESNTSERLINGLDYIDKLVRAKVGNKLVTLKYDDNKVSITIEDFAYQYDVLIDPGHGGDDTGASNRSIEEKTMNLTVSQYEKCRFESMGYKVYMTRNSDIYGSGMGSAPKRLHKRAYEMGYYGVVSKVVYSNHHNALSNTSYMGYELLVPGGVSSSDLAPEIAIVGKFNNIYPLSENHLRVYATDYNTETKYNMLVGNTYSFKDNYAVNRIPFSIFNVKAIIYENCYLTNNNDFNWYWTNGNWKQVSEAKIEGYINYMGGTYNSDTSGC